MDHIVLDEEICFHELVLGNGQCDDFANRKECAFDRGKLLNVLSSFFSPKSKFITLNCASLTNYTNHYSMIAI